MAAPNSNRRRATRAAAVLVSLLGAGAARAEPSAAPPPAPWAAPAAVPLPALVPAELLARAASPDPAARIAAVGALSSLATPAALNLVAVMLARDIDPAVRAWAASALGASHDPDFIPALEWAGRADYDPAVRASAAAAVQALAPFARRPKVAAGFSVLCPGCGYFYLREPGRAVAFLGAAGALLGAALVVLDQTPVNDGGEHPDGRAMPLEMAIQELWFYGIFASYRDARLARDDIGAHFPVAREHLPELVTAPFNPRVLKSPYVWAGLPVLVGAAVGYGYLVSRFVSLDNGPPTRSLGDPGGVTFFGHHYGTGAGFALGSGYNATLYDMVAVGEESLFRGVVQSGLSETSLGLWGGWAAGSAIFGGIHAFNFIGEEHGFKTAAVAVPYIALTGSYLGYVFIKKDFSLLTGVAVHFWYDFALATIDFIADPDHQPFVARVAFPF